MEQPEAPEGRRSMARDAALAVVALSALLTALLAVLKVTGAIGWPWHWCLLPLRISLYAFVAFAGGAAVLAVITDFFNQRR